MGKSGTLLGRPFVRGESHSSVPERTVIILVLVGVFASYDRINQFVQEVFGVSSQILTLFLLILIVPLFSDWLFRAMLSITGRK